MEYGQIVGKIRRTCRFLRGFRSLRTLLGAIFGESLYQSLKTRNRVYSFNLLSSSVPKIPHKKKVASGGNSLS